MINDDASRYLDELDVTRVTRERLEVIYEIVKILSPEEVKDLFLTEVIADNGIRQYLNAWFFTENYTLEAKNFMLSSEIDLVSQKDNISYVQFTAESFNYIEPDETSRLTVIFSALNPSTLGGQLTSTGNNCKFLLDLSKKYFTVNLKPLSRNFRM